MLGPIILIAICLMLLGLSIYLFLQGLRKTAKEKVLNRLAAGQPQLAVEQAGGWDWNGCFYVLDWVGRASVSVCG